MTVATMTTLRRRLILLLCVTVLSLVILFSYKENRTLYPYPNVLGSTWYGPALLLSIPIVFAWVAQAFKSRLLRIVGTVAALLLAATFVHLIIVGYQRARPHF